MSTGSRSTRSRRSWRRDDAATRRRRCMGVEGIRGVGRQQGCTLRAPGAFAVQGVDYLTGACEKFSRVSNTQLQRPREWAGRCGAVGVIACDSAAALVRMAVLMVRGGPCSCHFVLPRAENIVRITVVAG